MPTGVFTAGETLIAFSASHRRFDRNAIADAHMRYAAAHRVNDSGTLMTHCKRKLDNLAADAASGIVVDV
jgi:hypothetical protein